MNPWRLILGLILSAAIGWVGYKKQSLSLGGVAGAVIVGALIFGFGGWVWGLLLVAFFVSSSLLSRYRHVDKEPLAEKFAKGHRRDLGQTLANGGWGAVLAVAHALWPGPALFAAFVGAMAAVNADTWATEIGVLSPDEPRLITTGRRAPTGTSGGVTWLGTEAALLGGLFIGLTAFVLRTAGGLWQAGTLDWRDLWLMMVAGGSGLLGSMFDSLLGATVQGIYYCDACQKETESVVHRCGHRTRPLRGWRWLDNDVVNFLSSVVGGLAAAGLLWLIG